MRFDERSAAIAIRFVSLSVLLAATSILTTCLFGRSVRAAENEKDAETILADQRYVNQTSDPARPSSEAVDSLDVASGLEATLFASEPMMLSPSSIDIDHRGRVWVCEIVNYRRNRGKRPAGDRILILEDTDGDGKADESTVFHQGNDVDSAHGICVLGNRVIVSCGDSVFWLIDEDGDDQVDRKELLFTGIDGSQHDHGIHAFMFGPDGRLYFNMGNAGHRIADRKGNLIIDLAGNEVATSRQPYQDGLVFRCNPDGSEFETLGWNFRNNWEVTVDSFGTMWQSDNDDDGSRGVRINYVMEFGNFGFRDEKTGAGWKDVRTGMHPDIPLRHWHQNDPGVVPNLLQTGAGSPTGIVVYEGKLFPGVFHDQILHTDAGPNVARSYPVRRDGAGYRAGVVDILTTTKDRWFRPSDIAIAPDGSIIVADWYDPGVGGHNMGDIERGRLFLVKPPDHSYRMPSYDFSTIAGATRALQSPNGATRYLAWTALHERGGDAEKSLLALYGSSNPRHRARALWLLGRIEGRGQHYVDMAIADDDPDIRIVGVRLARQLKLDVNAIVAKLTGDPSPQVRRECAIALRGDSSPRAAKLWAKLADSHDGNDRWYLEALGIGADGGWDDFFDAWSEEVGSRWNTPAGRDIVWRSRSKKTAAYLVRIIRDPSIPSDELPRYLRAFDFLPEENKEDALTDLVFETEGDLDGPTGFVITEALARVDGFDIASVPRYRKVLDQVLEENSESESFVDLIKKFHLTDRFAELLEIARSQPDGELGVRAIRALLSDESGVDIVRDALGETDLAAVTKTVRAVSNSVHGRALYLLLPLMDDPSRPNELRREAARGVGSVQKGAEELLERARKGSLDLVLQRSVAATLHNSMWNDIRKRSRKIFPLPPSKDKKPLPPMTKLIKGKGSAEKGKIIFETTGKCSNCHVVNGAGKEVGPALSEIGGKLSREALFESVIYPSAGISHDYQASLIALEDGNLINGIIISETDKKISVKLPDAIVRTFDKEEIVARKESPISIMPEDVLKDISTQDLVDLIEYLSRLKKAK